MKKSRIVISFQIRYFRLIQALYYFFFTGVFRSISPDIIWNIRKSNMVPSRKFMNYEKIHELWDEAGSLWEIGKYKESVKLRKSILEEVYEAANIFDSSYAPPLMEEWWVTRVGHLAVLGAFIGAQKQRIVSDQKRTLLVGNEIGNKILLNEMVPFFNYTKIGSGQGWSEISNFWHLTERLQLIRTNSGFIDQYELWEKVFNSGLEINKKNPILQMSDKYTDTAKESFSKLGLSADQKFVCLHVRGSRDWTDRRSQNLNDYTKSIAYLISIGYKIVRIGDTTMEYLEESVHIIDLTRLENAAIDLHLYAMVNCEFFLGTTSGPSWVPPIYGTPVLMTNATSIGKIMLSSSAGSRYIPKKIYDFKASRYLKFEEILGGEHAYAEFSIDDLRRKNLILENNSEVDILNGTIEMVNYLSNPILDTSEIQRLNMGHHESQISAGVIAHGHVAKSFLLHNKHLF